MARTKKPVPKPRRRFGLWIGQALAAAIVGFLVWMHLCARIVHVRYAEVHLDDLPASFDGTTLLYVSDVDVCGLNTPWQAARTIQRLQALEPDVLLLGGDYASADLLDRLNGHTSAEESAARGSFFAGLAGFNAPLGKLAISGDGDGDASQLALQMSASGVQLIDGGAQILDNGTDSLAIVGLGSQPADVTAIASQFSSADCVLVLAHSPDQLIDVQIAEAADGGAWADLVLAGHTHGGQVRLFGRTALSLTEMEERYLAGWYDGDTLPVLVTQGLGCEGANFRLGTQAEVWFITLRTGSSTSGESEGASSR